MIEALQEEYREVVQLSNLTNHTKPTIVTGRPNVMWGTEATAAVTFVVYLSAGFQAEIILLGMAS